MHVRVLAELPAPSTFKFLSVFKWEFRKGWDVLLTSFLTEFTLQDNVRVSPFLHPRTAWGATSPSKYFHSRTHASAPACRHALRRRSGGCDVWLTTHIFGVRVCVPRPD
jgi:hypothetical protein